MFKKVLARVATGFAWGALAGQAVMLIVSLAEGDGRYHAVAPAFAAHFSLELAAVALQTLLTGLIGVAFAAGALLFGVDALSFLKQYLLYVALTAAVLLPVVMVLWMPQNPRGVLNLALNLAGIYLLNWAIQFILAKRDVRRILREIRAANSE